MRSALPSPEVSFRRPLSVLAALVLCAIATGALAGFLRVEADEPVVKIEAVFRPLGPSSFPQEQYAQLSHVYANPAARRALFMSTGPQWLSFHDLDTLQPVGSGIDPLAKPTMVLPDLAEPVFWIGTKATSGAVSLRQYVSRPAGVTLVGSLDLTAQVSGRDIIGMYRLPRSDVAWLLSANQDRSVAVSEISLGGIESGKAAHHWTADQPGCTTAMHGQINVPAALGFVPDASGGWLYFGCGNASGLGVAGVPGARGAARVRVDGQLSQPGQRGTPGRFEIFPHAGDFSDASSHWDPLSHRLVMSAYSAVTRGTTVYVFDAQALSYTGAISAGSNALSSSGFDPVSGRFYALSIDAATGLVLADVRPTPASQGASIREFTKGPKGGQPGLDTNIAVDPPTGRVFMKYSTGDFVVARDNLLRYVPLPPPDPDDATVDIPEAPGKTSASYGAATQGFGARARQLGGVSGVVINVGFENTLWPAGPGTREYRGAYVNRQQITNDEAVSSVVAADVDDANSDGDLRKTRTVPPPPPGEVPQQLRDPISEGAGEVREQAPVPEYLAQWPYHPASCADFGSTPSSAQAEGAEVSCSSEHHEAAAKAVERRATGSTFVVSDSSIDARSRLDPVKGAYASVTATSRGVSVLSQLEIGEVSVVAKAWAKGRPGTAGGEFTRTLRNVKLQGQLLCTDNCDTARVAQQINERLGAFLRVDFPAPDPTYLNGTKRGYQAVVRRSPAEHLSEVLAHEQPLERQEVPGMVVSFVQDGFKPSRVILELAAAGVEARYGISAIDGGVDDDTIDPGIALDLGATGEGPLFGLNPDSVANVPRGGLTPLDNGGPRGFVGSARRIIWNGLGLAADLLPVWAVLLVPVYLSARRWLLLQRATLRG